MEATDSKPENCNDQDNKSPGVLLGQKLKKGRELNNYSLERVAMATKISLPFIKALESDELDKLPEEVFARGFIRNLAKLYELEEKELLFLFDNAMMERHSHSSDEGSSDYRKKPRGKSGYPSKKQVKSRPRRGIFKPSSMTVLLLGLIIGIGLVAWDYYNKTPSVVSDTKVSKPTIKKPQVNTVKKIEVDSSDSIVSNNKNPDVQSSSEDSDIASGTQVVLVKVLNKVRIRIAKDNGAAVTENLAPDSYKYRFQDELRMFVYDSSAVEISYNGKSIGDIGGSGEYSRLAFKANKAEKSKESR